MNETIKKTEKSKKHNFLANMIYTFKTQVGYTKVYTWLLPIYIILCIIVPVIATFVPTIIVGFVEEKVEMLYFLIGISVLVISFALLNSSKDYVKERLTWLNTYVRVNKSIYEMIEKNMSMDYCNLEPASCKQRFEKASMCLSSNWEGLELIMKLTPDFIVNFVGIVVYSFFLTNISIYVLLVLILMTICNIALSLYANKYQENNNPIISDKINKIDYFSYESKQTDGGKDIRIYKLQKWFNSMIKILNTSLAKTTLKIQTVNNFPAFSDTIFTIARDLIAYSILIKQVIDGKISPTEFTFYLGIITGFTTWLNGFTSSMLQIRLASLRVDDFREFLSYKDKFLHEEGKPCLDLMDKPLSIRFDHVSFTYPEANAPTINDLTFEIKAHEKIALVGINGAGKTTIIKLLTGMYMPTSGKIFINDEDISKLNIIEYHKLIGAIYQDVEILAYTIVENVSCLPIEDTDRDKALDCLQKADLLNKINELTNKEETYLTKTIDANGIELSGGQKQRLMLARALYKDAPILVLDEPTAALDPLAELDLYQKYNALTETKTSIFISHRLSSTQFCDKILFLENGMIIEEGTHQELMKLNGKYRYMFDIQAQYYRDEENNTNNKVGEENGKNEEK